MLSAIAARRAAAPSIPSSPAPATSKSPAQQPKRKDPPDATPAVERTQPAAKRQKKSPAKSSSSSSTPATAQQPRQHAEATPLAPSAVAGPSKRSKRAYSPSQPVLSDSSDEEDHAANDDQAPIPGDFNMTDAADDIISTFSPVLEQNVFPLNDNELAALSLTAPSHLFLLQPHEKLTVIGTTSLLVLKGVVTIDGVTLKPARTAHKIFAPSSHPAPCITAVDPISHPLAGIPPSIRTRMSAVSAIGIVLSELRTGVEGLSDVCHTFDDIFEPDLAGCAPLPVNGLFIVEHASRRIQPFRLPKSWEQGMLALEASTVKETATPSLVVMVKGPKRCGKSTLARTLRNRLLTRYRQVAYLECDVGQSEFTPAGMVALHVLDRPQFGPPFTHLIPPHVAHFTGSTSPRNHPTQYLSCISACIQSYQIDIQYGTLDAEDTDDDRISEFVPLVINTHGWNKGLGADLTTKIQDMISVTDIFDLDSHSGQSQQVASRIHAVSAVSSSLATLYSASDMRVLNLLSYFYSRGLQIWDTELPLCAKTPYEVTWSAAIDSVILACPGGEDVPPSELHTALNGGIVALVATDSPPRSDSDPLYTQAAPPPSPLNSRCIGLAFIRWTAAAADSDTFHLLTPVSPDVLATCGKVILVKGELEMPVWGWIDHRLKDGQKDLTAPYLQWGSVGEGKGAARRRVRRNLMRWGQR